MLNRKVLRLTDAEYVAIASKLGSDIISTADSLENAGSPFTSELKFYLKKLPSTNPDTSGYHPKVKSLIETYQGLVSGKDTIADGVQKLGDTAVSITRYVSANKNTAPYIWLVILPKPTVISYAATHRKKGK